MISKPQIAHLHRIDVLRASAILMVICFHFLPFIIGRYEMGWNGLWRDVSEMPPLIWVFYPFTLGWSGVALFFVISGFCIHYSFLKHEASQRTQNEYVWMFLWKRFWRIYPAYLFALALVFYLTLRHDSTRTSINQFWLHLLMVHNFTQESFSSINPSFWSLAVEMQFYLLFPLFLLLRRKMGGVKKAFWLFAGISVVSRIVSLKLQDWEQQPSQYVWDFTLTLFVDWLLGAWLAERWICGKKLLNLSFRQTLAFGFIAVALTLNKITVAIVGFTAFSLWYAMIMELYLFSSRPISKLEKWMIPVGLSSYSIYLLHQPLLGRAVYWLHQIGLPQDNISTLCSMPLIIGIIIIVGYCSYRVFEIPGVAFGKRLHMSFALQTKSNTKTDIGIKSLEMRDLQDVDPKPK